MKTMQFLRTYFSKGTLPEIDEFSDSKSDLADQVKLEFEDLLEEGANPLLAFQALYHRLTEIANVAKEVFYKPAIEWLKANEGSGNYYGAKVTLKTMKNYEVIKSPKILKLEKELESLTKKNEKVIKSFEKFNIDKKSIESQIKAEENALVEKGMGTLKSENHTITLKY